jgi:hypothetical protein
MNTELNYFFQKGKVTMDLIERIMIYSKLNAESKEMLDRFYSQLKFNQLELTGERVVTFNYSSFVSVSSN